MESAWETVGFERPVSLAIWARETGPASRMRSRTVLSLIARRRLGVPVAYVCCAAVTVSSQRAPALDQSGNFPNEPTGC